jgi:hypothetical protein
MLILTHVNATSLQMSFVVGIAKQLGSEAECRDSLDSEIVLHRTLQLWRQPAAVHCVIIAAAVAPRLGVDASCSRRLEILYRRRFQPDGGSASISGATKLCPKFPFQGSP